MNEEIYSSIFFEESLFYKEIREKVLYLYNLTPVNKLLGRLASSRPDKGGDYRYDAEAWPYCTWWGGDVITALQEYPFMSYRAATRYPEILAKAGTRK